ncbi:Sodium/hydrogen exchanger [Beggiatoa sp. PS]|nr:Sodium/hydrogen exchanger [Beggiatoa sp. PS]
MILTKQSYAQSRLSWIYIVALFLCLPTLASASGSGGEIATGFLWIAVLLLLAKLSSLIERWGQPAVLGELMMGVVLGNLVLVGINWFEPVKHDQVIKFLAELGVVILLFQIGLESKIQEMQKVGWQAFWVAIVGVIVPFVLGTYIVGPWLMPGLNSNAYLFLGAALTATSVGITGRVFRDLGKLQTREAQIVLGAAVIDDVMGLIILAVVSAIVTTGAVSINDIGLITLKAILFLIGAIVLGRLLAPQIGRFFSLVNTGIGMKFSIAISFCLIFAYLAHLVGLAPIVGAFAAGLMLEPVYFQCFEEPIINKEIKTAVNNADDNTKDNVNQILAKYNAHHLDELVAPLGHFLVPLFFIMIGMEVDLKTLSDPNVILVALAITAVAFIGKIVAGIVAGDVNKWIVGWGMAPRGEVGLIFAMIGKQLGVVSESVFSVIIIMVILTTLLTPPILNYLLRKQPT